MRPLDESKRNSLMNAQGRILYEKQKDGRQDEMAILRLRLRVFAVAYKAVLAR